MIRTIEIGKHLPTLDTRLEVGVAEPVGVIDQHGNHVTQTVATARVGASTREFCGLVDTDPAGAQVVTDHRMIGHQTSKTLGARGGPDRVVAM
jgi:hypothetical protein